MITVFQPCNSNSMSDRELVPRGGTENVGVENAGVEISAQKSRKRQGMENAGVEKSAR